MTRIILCSLVSVVCDVRCACVRVWASVKKCLFVCLLRVPSQLSRGLRLCQYRNRHTRDPTLSTHSCSQNIVILTREPWSEGLVRGDFLSFRQSRRRSLREQTRQCFRQTVFPRNLWL